MAGLEEASILSLQLMPEKVGEGAFLSLSLFGSDVDHERIYDAVNCPS